MAKQIRFYDSVNEVKHSGILLDNGDVICGCCGGLIEADEFKEDCVLLEKYETWIDIDEEIIGVRKVRRS